MHTEVLWDAAKGAENVRKHGVSFNEAASTLLDPVALVREDPDSRGEQRWVLVGLSERLRLLTVVYALGSDGRIRLISARAATRKEAAGYA